MILAVGIPWIMLVSDWGTLPSVPPGTQGEVDWVEVYPSISFQNKTYRKVERNDNRFSLPLQVNEEAVGEKIGEIKGGFSGPDDGIYAYKPAGCQAVVAVRSETGDGYDLYQFESFTSYEQNRDEDASAYLELYGIHSAQDIAKLECFPDGVTDKLVNTVTDPQTLTAFHDFFAPLIDSSKAYFEKLSEPLENAEKGTAPPQMESTPDGAQTPAYEGTAGDKLADASKLRIVTMSGLYFEVWYYPNIKFLSRYQIDDAFASFLDALTDE